MKSSKLLSMLICLLLLSFLWSCKGSPLELSVRYESLGDLKPEASVYFEKDRIGHIEKIVSTERGDFLVKIVIDPEYKNKATEYSRFYIAPDPLEDGLTAVVVEQDKNGGEVLDNGAIVKGERRGLIGQFMARLQQTGTEASKKLEKAIIELRRSFSEGTQQFNSEIEKTLDDMGRSFEELEKSWQSSSGNDELQKMRKSFDDFIDEFRQAGTELQGKLREEVIPELQRQLQELQQKLRREHREEDADQIQRQLDEIRSI